MTREVIWGDIPEKTENKASTLPYKIAQALGGGATGLAQGVSDLGANIAQFPSDIYTYFTGKKGYTAPKPDFRDLAPQSGIGQKAEAIGEFASPFVGSPALAAESLLGKALFGGRLLPRIAMGSTLGAAESENRRLGGALGATAPAVGRALRYVKETPFTEAGATKKLEKAKKVAGNEPLGIPVGLDFIRNLDYQLNSPHLKPSKMQLNSLIGEAAKGDYPSYFALQSALGDIGRELMYPSSQKGKGLLGMLGNYLSPPQTNAAERLTGRQLEQLRNQYISEAMEHLNKTGKGNIANLETQGRKEYRAYKKFEPIRNKALITAVGALGVPGYHMLKHLFHD